MKLLNLLRNLRMVLVGAVLCLSVFHLVELNQHRQLEVDQRIAAMKSHGVQNPDAAPVIALPTTDGVYTADLDANFQQAIVQTVGEVIVAYLLVMALFAGINQILGIRIDDLV